MLKIVELLMIHYKNWVFISFPLSFFFAIFYFYAQLGTGTSCTRAMSILVMFCGQFHSYHHVSSL